MGNPVVYFDVNSPQGDALKRFYADLFGWAFNEVPGGYALADTQAGAGINGGIGTTTDDSTPLTFYVEAAELQAVLNKAESLGGKTLIPVTEIPGMVTYALLADPDGLVVGLVKSATGGPSGQGPTQGAGTPVDWFEVLGVDGERTQAFYTQLFGWKLDESGPPGYRLVDTDAGGRGIGGGFGSNPESPWATVYARVSDVEGTLKRAEELGGKREYGPTAVDDHMQTGAFRDPADNVFGVYFHPPHD
jgi:predicted enzyme related to lactoylglutathione lyase